MNYKMTGFLGCGNMGGALAKAAAMKTTDITLTCGSSDRAARLAEELGVMSGTNTSAAAECDLIFLGVKPQKMAELFAEIAPVLENRTDRFVLVSMAAGLTISRIRELAGKDYPVVRIMPNTPASIGLGMIQYCHEGVEPDEITALLELMDGAGIWDELPEHLIDAASSVSGCGPAFVYPFIEALADGGVAAGLPRDKAIRYAAQTLVGAASLVLESGKHPGALKDAVCSPGGSTIQGVRALERGGFRSSVMEAVLAAYQKNQDLGK